MVGQVLPAGAERLVELGRVAGPDDSWVPDACTLPTAERPLRLAEFDGPFRDALRGVGRPAGTCGCTATATPNRSPGT